MRTEDVRHLLEPVVRDTGADLEDVQVAAAGKRRRVTVVVDADGGVDLDRVAAVSQAVSAALDGSDVMGETPYVLEVTSPGVDRPLTLPRHWRRNAGRLVDAELADGTTVRGRVVSADDDAVALDVDGEPREFALAEIVRGRVQIEFARSPASDSASEPTVPGDSGE